ncbi:MAG: transposase [Opitutaceae bacterium]|nr:transposase [Opitutaceae bacterium]
MPHKPYRLESQRDEQKVDGQRSALRQEHFARPLAELEAHAQALLAGPGAAQPGFVQGTCTHLPRHRESLTTHLRFSQTGLDPDSVENIIGPSKLGAKNWFFIRHSDAGQRSAILYSMVVCCRRHEPRTRLPACGDALIRPASNDQSGRPDGAVAGQLLAGFPSAIHSGSDPYWPPVRVAALRHLVELVTNSTRQQGTPVDAYNICAIDFY